MLSSKRNFGVEIEFVAPNQRSLQSIADRIRVVPDGSLRPLEYAGEYVSNILSGKSGESEIFRVCDILKQYGADTSNPATSVHVHLDGRITGGEVRSSRKNPQKDGYVIAVSNRLKDNFSSRSLSAALKGRTPLFDFGIPINVAEFNGVLYHSLARLGREPRMNYTYYWIEGDDRFEWLRNTLYFYTAFSEVTEDLVSNSRKWGNMYCIPLHKSFDLPEIEKCETIADLRGVWYKGGGTGGHYNDSRYHSVNLHSFWDRHGTVEIRSHGGTIDPHKILLWIKLHQKIVDKLEDIDFDELKSICNREDKHQAFLEFIEEPLLQEYVRRLVGYFSDKRI